MCSYKAVAERDVEVIMKSNDNHIATEFPDFFNIELSIFSLGAYRRSITQFKQVE